jgi:calcium/calmodulin-dependent protein kinase kinase 2
MKAISKFKSLLGPKGSRSQTNLTPTGDDGSLTPRGPSIKDLQIQHKNSIHKSTDEHVEELLRQREQFRGSTESLHEKGHAHEVTDTEPLFLGIGAGGHDDFGSATREAGIVSDSPTAVDFNVYDRAFEQEVDRIKRSSSKRKPTGNMFLTRFVNKKDQYKEDDAIVDAPNRIAANEKGQDNDKNKGKGRNLADVVGQAAKDLIGQHKDT